MGDNETTMRYSAEFWFLFGAEPDTNSSRSRLWFIVTYEFFVVFDNTFKVD